MKEHNVEDITQKARDVVVADLTQLQGRLTEDSYAKVLEYLRGDVVILKAAMVNAKEVMPAEGIKNFREKVTKELGQLSEIKEGDVKAAGRYLEAHRDIYMEGKEVRFPSDEAIGSCITGVKAAIESLRPKRESPSVGRTGLDYVQQAVSRLLK